MILRHVPLLFGVFSLAACSPPEPSNLFEGSEAFLPFARSGSRIEFIGADFEGWQSVHETRDTVLDVKCGIQGHSGGRGHCIPTGETAHGVPLYASDDCSGTPVLWTHDGSSCPVTPRYGVLPRILCDETSLPSVLELSATPAPAQTLFRLYGGTNCGPAGGDVPFFVGTEVPPEDLASGDVTTELNASGVGVVVFEGDDGSRRVLGEYDERHGRVMALDTELGGRRLVSTSVVAAASGYYADPMCEQETPVVADPCEGVAYAMTLDGPGSRARIHEIGEPLATVYEQTGQDCVATEGGNVYGVGEELDPSTLFSPHETLVRQLTPELRQRVVATITGEILRGTGPLLLDEETACSPTQVGEVVRCAPSPGQAATQYFSDAECSLPLLAVVDPTTLEEWVRVDLDHAPLAPQCGVLPEADDWFRTVGVYGGPVFIGEPENCYPDTPPAQLAMIEIVADMPTDYPQLSWGRL